MASYDVFTPPEVSAKMRSYVPEHVGTLLEPSVGAGDLLNAMEGLYDHADVFDINPDYLARIPESPRITKTRADFLQATISTKYDAVVMNPPYLRFQEMSADTRKCVRGLSDVLKTGNIDLYIAFLVKCIGLLKETGTLVAIVPSTWMYNRSAVQFRDWLFSNRWVRAIHDYGSQKVFPGINVYCCILVVDFLPKTSYTLNDREVSFETPESEVGRQTLHDTCDIQNGIATLCDSVFIHDTPLFDEPCWRPVLKVSKRKVRSIVYPYDPSGAIIPEETFRTQNPNTYTYLVENRAKLAARDRGNKTYEQWYAFGRKQGIQIPSAATSVYVSTLSSPDVPTFCSPTMLFYSGIRITPRTISCEEVQAAIEEQKDTIIQSSSKRSSNWINLTTTTLRRVQQ